MITVASFGESGIYLKFILAHEDGTTRSSMVSSGVGRNLLVAGAGFTQAPTIQKAI
jgi:hypothetical protein